LTKILLTYSVSNLNLGGLELCLWAKLTKAAPWRRDWISCAYSTATRYVLVALFRLWEGLYGVSKLSMFWLC